MAEREGILGAVETYYTGRFSEHGATPRGVDWNSTESQEVRFAQLARACPDDRRFSLLDYGCGYGALLPYLRARGLDVDYTGFDLSASMLEHARDSHPDDDGATFIGPGEPLPVSDVVIASGIFNVRLESSREDWHEYVLATVRELDALTRSAFAFNCLTSYSDADRMRDDLYYGDGPLFFDFAKRELSPSVALLHDYGLWEWTLIVRKGV